MVFDVPVSMCSSLMARAYTVVDASPLHRHHSDVKMFAHHQLRWCRVKVGVYTFSYFGVSSVDVPPSQCSCDSPLRQRRFTTIVIHAYIHVQTPHQSHPHVPHQLRRNVVILSYPLVMYRNGTIDGDHFLSLSFFLCVCTCVVPYFDCLFDLIVALLISFSLVVVAQVCISFSLASSHLSPPPRVPLTSPLVFRHFDSARHHLCWGSVSRQT